MGSRATRITRDELLTPPEFRGLHLAEHQAGRVGGARIELVRARRRDPPGNLLPAGPGPRDAAVRH